MVTNRYWQLPPSSIMEAGNVVIISKYRCQPEKVVSKQTSPHVNCAILVVGLHSGTGVQNVGVIGYMIETAHIYRRENTILDIIRVYLQMCGNCVCKRVLNFPSRYFRVQVFQSRFSDSFWKK